MVEAAAAAVEARGLANVETRQIDAQQIELADASVDGVMSRYGLMLVPDRDAAFSEIRRVLKPGRPLAYAVWGPIEANPWMMVFGAAMMQHGHWTPEDERGLPLTTEEENREVLSKAGFEEVSVEFVNNPMRYKSIDDYWEVSKKISGPVAVIAGELTEEQLSEVKSTVDEFVSPFATEAGVDFPAQTVVVRAG